MSRIARVVVKGVAHHITQRGNRCQKTFFEKSDYEEYIRLMSHWCKEDRIRIVAYCLMPNHVHLVGVPKDADKFSHGIGEAHRRYTRYINFKKKWKGYLWQGRFSSCPMDENHLYEAVRYVEMNPVRAGLCKSPFDYEWSSANAHKKGEGNELVDVRYMLNRVDEKWAKYLKGNISDDKIKGIRLHQRTGRPFGDEKFLSSVERKTGRTLGKMKTGPKNNGNN